MCTFIRERSWMPRRMRCMYAVTKGWLPLAALLLQASSAHAGDDPAPRGTYALRVAESGALFGDARKPTRSCGARTRSLRSAFQRVRIEYNGSVQINGEEWLLESTGDMIPVLELHRVAARPPGQRKYTRADPLSTA